MGEVTVASNECPACKAIVIDGKCTNPECPTKRNSGWRKKR